MNHDTKKKVGILTFHRTLNYGAVLQCFALTEIVSNASCEASVIDYRSPIIEQREMKPRLFSRRNIKNLVGLPFEMLMKCARRHSFSNSKIKVTALYSVKSGADLAPQLQDLDSVIVGSDQVWNLGLTGEDFQYFLPGSAEVKKNSYAASFGSKKVSQANKVAECLRDFEHVGVREADGVKIAREMGIDATQVLDPTLLLTSEQWCGVSSHTRKLPERYILAYAVNMKDDVVSRAKKIAAEYQIPLVYVHSNDWAPVAGAKNIYTAGPDEFIALIRNAETVVTSSFHGTCFSIMMHKPFTVVMNQWKENANSRLESLLKLIGINEDEVAEQVINPDWNNVDKRLEIERKYSLDFLKEELD